MKINFFFLIKKYAQIFLINLFNKKLILNLLLYYSIYIPFVLLNSYNMSIKCKITTNDVNLEKICFLNYNKYIMILFLTIVLEYYSKFIIFLSSADIYTFYYDYFFENVINSNAFDIINTIKVCNTYFSLCRRTNPIAKSIVFILYRFPSVLIIFFSAVNSLIKNQTRFVLVILLIVFIICFFSGIILYYHRNRLTELQNKNFIALSEELINIYDNYFLLHNFNTFEYEYKKFSNVCFKECISLRLLWFTNEIIIFFKDFILILEKFYLLSVFDYKKAASIFFTLDDYENKLNNFLKYFELFFQESHNVCYSILDNVESDKKYEGLNFNGFDNSIKIKNFYFKYSENLVLKNLNFIIYKGEKVALFGLNGKGKSTLIQSLIRISKNSYYDSLNKKNSSNSVKIIDYLRINNDNADKSGIFIDNINIDNISKSSLRNLISFLPQDFNLFKGTIIDNIRCFNSKITDDCVYKICKEFNTYDDLKKIGFNTEVCNCPVNIKQSVAFMRSILKKAPIFLFDEPFSLCDKKNFEKFYDLVFSKLKDKTIIISIHDISKLKLFDKIVYFGNENVVTGTYDYIYNNFADFRELVDIKKE